MTLLNINLLGKMGFGAFSGFDACAIFSAEVQDQDVARTIRKSVWIAAPLIALFYTLGTACVLAFSTPDKIDLISSSAQVLSLGASTYGMGVWPATLGAAVLILGTVCSGSLYFNALVRLPMVAGWDRLVPETMSRLHQRYKTPAGSIVIVAVLGVGLSIAGHSGVGAQEAFQLINSAGMVCWGLAYMSMFAIPLLSPGERPSWGIRIAAISGFAMTLLSAVLGLFPILDVASVGAFAAKVGGVVVAINALAAWHYKRVTNHTAPAMEIKTDA